MSLHPNQVLLAPVVSEKSYSLITDRKYTFKVHEDAHKTQIRQAVEELFEVQGAERQHREGAVEAEAARLHQGPPAGLEEGDRRSSREGTRSRSSKERPSDGAEEVQADEPRSPLHGRLRVRGRHEVGAREVAPRAADEEGRSEQPRPHHDAAQGRRAQATLPRHRLQAHEGRRSCEGGRDRVRPEPVGPDRAPPLRRRREGVHPRAGAPARRRGARVRPGCGHQARERAAAREHPDGHARPLPSSSGPARAPAWRARPARRSSSSRRTGRTASSGSPRASCGACFSRVARRSGRSATRITRTSRAARRAGADGSGSDRRCAGRR